MHATAINRYGHIFLFMEDPSFRQVIMLDRNISGICGENVDKGCEDCVDYQNRLKCCRACITGMINDENTPGNQPFESSGMKVKLAYKLFFAFLITSLMSIVMMVGIMQYFVVRNFEDFINKMEMQRLGEIAERLGAAYQENKGWGFIIGDPGAFHKILRPGFPGEGHERMPPAPIRPDSGPGPQMPGNDFERELPLPEPHHFIEQRISLYDAQKRVVAGSAFLTKDHIFKEITINGKIVGWLGLDKGRRPPDPLKEKFLSRQLEAFFITGCAVLVLAAFVSLLLSRHLLLPVGRLSEGANALASRKFNTRIKVSTGDELGQLADAFNRMAQTLERYEELRKQWISDISHELRTPIAILRGEIEAIQDGVHEMTRENMESLHSEVMLLGKLVNDLHELSMADTGALSAKQEPVDVIKVLQDTLGMFSSRFSKELLTVHYDQKPTEPTIVLGDKDRLAQVFSNILENTLRYTESPGELMIHGEKTDNDVRIVFEDTQPGVPHSALERLFDRLYRIDPARSRKNGGSGLGLAICKNIVEAFGGEIRADHSGLGGLRLEITLPLARNT
jgi:two-component system sensor histidine kinase BaeS